MTTRAVTLTLRLPEYIADAVEQANREDPELLGRMLVYGVTRRAICEGLREQERQVEATG